MSSYIFCPARLVSNFSRSEVISLTPSLILDRIHLSSSRRTAVFSSAIGRNSPFSPWRFMIVNLEAFHSLLAKFLADSSFALMNLMSLPGEIPVASMNLRASAPTSLMTSSGSIPLPRDFDILRPCSSLTRPWIYTYLNGISPMVYRPENTILTTQKKMIS